MNQALLNLRRSTPHILADGFAEFVNDYWKLPGVYIISTPSTFLYVGTSSNLARRACASIRQRLVEPNYRRRNHRFDLTRSYRLSLITVENTNVRRELEAFAIKHLKPTLNIADEAKHYADHHLDAFSQLKSHPIW